LEPIGRILVVGVLMQAALVAILPVPEITCRSDCVPQRGSTPG
jgi:hypothetical protein